MRKRVRVMPVEDPVTLLYTGPNRVDAIKGPVTGKGYAPRTGQECDVEKADADALLSTVNWERPKGPTIKPRKVRVKEGEQQEPEKAKQEGGDK